MASELPYKGSLLAVAPLGGIDDTRVGSSTRFARELFSRATPEVVDPELPEEAWSEWHHLPGRVCNTLWFDPTAPDWLRLTATLTDEAHVNAPGLYEFGASSEDPDVVVVLYFGKANSLRDRIVLGYLKDGSDSAHEMLALLRLGCRVCFRWRRFSAPEKPLLQAETSVLEKWDYVMNSQHNDGARRLDSALIPVTCRNGALQVGHALQMEDAAWADTYCALFVDVIRAETLACLPRELEFSALSALDLVGRLRVADLLSVLTSANGFVRGALIAPRQLHLMGVVEGKTDNTRRKAWRHRAVDVPHTCSLAQLDGGSEGTTSSDASGAETSSTEEDAS